MRLFISLFSYKETADVQGVVMVQSPIQVFVIHGCLLFFVFAFYIIHTAHAQTFNALVHVIDVVVASFQQLQPGYDPRDVVTA